MHMYFQYSYESNQNKNIMYLYHAWIAPPAACCCGLAAFGSCGETLYAASPWCFDFQFKKMYDLIPNAMLMVVMQTAGKRIKMSL